MGTVHRQEGFSVVIYTHDHNPPHVHVFKSGAEVIITLNPIQVREIRGMSARDVRKALEIVASRQEQLLADWNRIAPVP